MMMADLVRSCRTIRRYRQDQAISRETLVELVDMARIVASGSNKQGLKYWLSSDPETNACIFPMLAWAGYMRDWDGPEEGERPAAYVIILGDKLLGDGFGVDHGIAAQTIALAAAEKGIGTCMIGSVQRIKLREQLSIPDRFDILLVLALGIPGEQVKIEEIRADDTRYWRDADGVHHVPKRSLDDVIVH
jgi:nitroreductase